MSRQPYIKVKCRETGNDVSEMITKFKFEDCTDQADLTEFGIEDTYALKVLDSDDFKRGNTFEFQFGFLGGVMSDVHVTVLKDIDATYGRNISVTLRGLDKGHAMRKGGVPTIWKDKLSSDIAQEIATKYSLKTVIDTTETTWKNLPQGNKSDFDFLRDLAVREKSGNFHFFVRGETLFFQKKDLGKDSVLTVQYGDEDFIEFSPQTRDSTKPTSADGVKTVGVDSFGKEVKMDIVTPATLKDDVSLDSIKDAASAAMSDPSKLPIPELGSIPATSDPATAGNTTFDAGGGVTPSTAGLSEYAASQIQFGDSKAVYVPLGSATDKNENSNTANNVVKSGNEKENKGTLKLEGNPLLMANVIITIKNVAAVHAGNWYVEKAEHVFGGGAYITTLDLIRKKGTGTVNKKQADSRVGEDTNQLASSYYDANGNLIKGDPVVMGLNAGTALQGKNVYNPNG